METTIQTLATLPTSKEGIQQVVEGMKFSVLIGETDVLQAEVIVKVMEDICKAYRKDEQVKEKLLEKVTEKTSAYGATFVPRSGSKSWDYSDCNKWCDLQQELELLKEKIKAVESGLQNASDDTPFKDYDINDKTKERWIKYTSFETKQPTIAVTIK